eukprot:s9143_g1.t2
MLQLLRAALPSRQVQHTKLMGGFRTTTSGKGEGSSRWEVKEAKDSGKGRKESGKRGGWKGDGKWWPDEDKGRKEGKHGKGKGKKGDEWQGKARDWSSRDRAGKGGEELGEAKESRSQLSSNAPDFQPSGMYDYDALAAQYWSWQPFLQEMPPLWREYADKAHTVGAGISFASLAVRFRSSLLHGGVSGCSS